jgi:viroplasmin and RNaseH domain-containing protein
MNISLQKHNVDQHRVYSEVETVDSRVLTHSSRIRQEASRMYEALSLYKSLSKKMMHPAFLQEIEFDIHNMVSELSLH